MKTKYALMSGLVMLLATAAFAQVEYDDMYFNSKDRAKLNASKEVILARQYEEEDKTIVKTSPINPTDSYSGRSVNPEYTNRLKVNSNPSASASQYFISGYQPANVNKNVASNNCNCGNSMYNPYYGGYSMNPYYNGMYGNSMYGFASPYSSFYSPWGMSMMGSSFYRPGFSSMFGYGLGGMYGGMGYGFGNSWGNPWNYGYGSSFYNSFGYGGYGMPYYGYGGYISNYYGNNGMVVSGGDYNNTVYGKRSSRSSDTNNLIDRSRPESAYTRNGRTVATGRSRSDNSQSQYYDRGWKRDPSINSSRSMWSDNSGSTSGSRSAWSNGSSSSGRVSSSNNNNWGGNSNSRSSFNSFGSGGSSFGGGSRSGGSSFGGGGGSSGGGHSRGR